MNKWSFDFLPPTIWSWNFSLNPVISSLERVKMFWWEREGCRVRRGEEGSKKKERGIVKAEKELLDFRCSQENKKVRRLLGSKNQIKDVDFWGGIRVWLGKISHPPFPTFGNHTFHPLSTYNSRKAQRII